MTSNGPAPRMRQRWPFLQLALFMAAWLLLAPQLQDRWLVQALLQAFVLNSVLVLLWSNPEWQRFRIPVLALWLASLAASLAATASGAGTASRPMLLLETAALLPLLGLVSIGILRHVRRSEQLRVDGIFATVVVYVLVALLFCRLYGLLLAWNPQSLHLPVPVAERTPQLLHVDLMYYSLITQASVGYGDVLPVSPTARMIAVLQAIVGQFYMAVIVAVFVGRLAAPDRD